MTTETEQLEETAEVPAEKKVEEQPSKKKKPNKFKKERVVRLFVALEVPAPVRKQMKDIAHGVIGVNWGSLDQLHLTLRFIGEVKPGVEERIKKALTEVCCRPMTVNLNSVGCFPPNGAPKVLWAGVQGGATELDDLHKSVENALEEAGLKKEQRFFRPHIILGRSKNASRKSVGTWQQQHANFKSSEFKMTNFCLFSNSLSKKGDVQNKEKDYKLKGSFL